MKKVLKFVKGKKDDKRESGGITPSQTSEFTSPAQTPEDEKFLGLDNIAGGYVVDFSGKDKTLTKLHKAAWQGNLEKLKSALKKVEVDSTDRHNRTALHFAVVQGHPNIVWFLLGNNASTSICDDDGCTPLLKAIECGHKECLKLLLERGTDINVADHTGNTGLHIAVKLNSADTVSALLNKGADLEVSDNAGDYPLHIATKSENKDVVNALLNAGAEVNVLDRENRTPLMLAAKNGNSILTSLFIERGASVTLSDSNGWAADDYALLGGHKTIASMLKTLVRDKNEKYKQENQDGRVGSLREPSETTEDNSKDSWKDSFSEKSDNKKDKVNKKVKEFFKNVVKDEPSSDLSEKEKEEETSESPSTQTIPPYCQPPRSWDMIQAGMIDDGKRTGGEAKRLSLTALGTLRSRRESFTEPASSTSPKHTHSLNRRKGAKVSDSFAKQRLSLNEDAMKTSVWYDGAKSVVDKTVENADSKIISGESALKSNCSRKKDASSDSDWDNDVAASKIETGLEINALDSTSDWDSSEKDGTLGRADTMKELDEIWVASSKEANFPPPPSALELGVDMAKSLKYMKGLSQDYSSEKSAVERNIWKKAYETHSLDRLEERSSAEISRSESLKDQFQHQSTSFPKWKSQEMPKFQKPTDKLIDVSRRINEQLECYDQALRELAESSTGKKYSSEMASNAFNYHSLPSYKVKRSTNESKRELVNEEIEKVADSAPSSAPALVIETMDSIASKCENNEKLGYEEPVVKSDADDAQKEPFKSRTTEVTDRKTKRDIMMAMREVKHAVQVSSAFKTSFDDQILSPLTKPQDDVFDEFDSKETQEEKKVSPLNGSAFFAIGRQETVLERKSSSSGTGDEPTLWLQNEVRVKGEQPNGSIEDVSEISEEHRHKRNSSFSPLGVIHREIQNESDNRNEQTNLGAIEAGHFKEEEPSNLRHNFPDKINGKENDESKEVIQDQSPDISLSSGPLEPLGIEKDSGSDPESSHNDVTPTHHYSLKDQHEWLKHHLKAATSEKNKLEEIAVTLSEKAERLQYELADAKEATKSRDEVIKLLQEQLSRMETAYTKSLEESVQSRLQLTSHEQEILHLKEICYKYEEEKNKEAADAEANNLLEKLEMKIKRLEDDKEKMREEISQLETEKTSLMKRLKEATESEMMDQCQRWKERFQNETDKEAEGKLKMSETASERERQLLERNSELEKKLLEVTEENLELTSNYHRMLGEMESDRKMTTAKKEIDESISELKIRNLEMESNVKRLEKEFEEKTSRALKEKEKEIEFLIKEFGREKDSLIRTYESKLSERKNGECRGEICRTETERLKEIIRNLQDQVMALEAKKYVENAKESLKNEIFELKDQCDLVSKSVVEIQSKDYSDFNFLLRENMNLKKAISEIKLELPRENSGIDFKDKYVELACENVKMKNVILDLKNQVNSLSLLVESNKKATNDLDLGPGGREKLKMEDGIELRSGEAKKRIGIEDRLAWTNLYGIKSLEQVRGWKSVREEIEDIRLGEKEGRASIEKFEIIKLKKEIAFLQSKMADEKSLRKTLENQISEINRDLKEKEILQQEIHLLKKKISRDYIQKSDLELVQYQKELQEKREKYLGKEEKEKPFPDDYKSKCEILAKEREKSKEINNKIRCKAKLLNSPPSIIIKSDFSPLPLHSGPNPIVQSLYGKSMHVTLEPEIKNQLDKELNKSIRKHRTGTSSSCSSPCQKI